MVWANTYKIGCGFSQYRSKEDMFISIYICLYRPRGNVADQSVYMEGSPCTQCPIGTSCSEMYDALCVPEDTNKPKSKCSKGTWCHGVSRGFSKILNLFNKSPANPKRKIRPLRKQRRIIPQYRRRNS